MTDVMSDYRELTNFELFRSVGATLLSRFKQTLKYDAFMGTWGAHPYDDIY